MRMDLDGPLLEDLPYHSPHSKRESDPGEPTSGKGLSLSHFFHLFSD